MTSWLTNGLGGKARGVEVDARAHPTLVLADVVNAIGNGLARFGAQVVVDLELFGLGLGLPFTTAALLLRLSRPQALTQAVA